MNYRELWFANNESNHGWYTCANCGKKIRKADVDIDHIIPQKHGGKDKLYNLQCLCKHCNRSKQASMDDTIPDLVKTNQQRAVKAVKKNAKFVKAHVVKGVKTAAKKATSKILKAKPSETAKKAPTKATTSVKKTSTVKKTSAATKTTATKKIAPRNKK